MNRQKRRALASDADRENRMWPAQLTKVAQDVWEGKMAPGATPPREVWRSRSLLVQVYDVPGHDGMSRVSVQRVTDASFRRAAWMGADTSPPISWDELQEVKRQIGREDKTAVEVYPPGSAVVAVAPMRHLWILDKAPDWMWQP